MIHDVITCIDIDNPPMLNYKFGAGAKMMWLLAAPAPQHWL
jgi:hypothetical protein